MTILISIKKFSHFFQFTNTRTLTPHQKTQVTKKIITLAAWRLGEKTNFITNISIPREIFPLVFTTQIPGP